MEDPAGPPIIKKGEGKRGGKKKKKRGKQYKFTHTRGKNVHGSEGGASRFIRCLLHKGKVTTAGRAPPKKEEIGRAHFPLPNGGSLYLSFSPPHTSAGKLVISLLSFCFKFSPPPL